MTQFEKAKKVVEEMGFTYSEAWNLSKTERRVGAQSDEFGMHPFAYFYFTPDGKYIYGGTPVPCNMNDEEAKKQPAWVHYQAMLKQIKALD